MTRSLDTLESAIDYRFEDRDLLEKALTHRSAGGNNNERLEFLGDSVLGCVIATELYTRFPDAREGRLSRLRASLVRRETLAGLGAKLDLGAHISLGAGERRSGGHRRDSILADAFEALFGAIYLDGGFRACQRVILALFGDELESRTGSVVLKDAKTRLQEFLQARRQPLPDYRLVDVLGVAHAQSFNVQCHVDGQQPTAGTGSNRRHAEQQAASRMLEQIGEG